MYRIQLRKPLTYGDAEVGNHEGWTLLSDSLLIRWWIYYSKNIFVRFMICGHSLPPSTQKLEYHTQLLGSNVRLGLLRLGKSCWKNFVQRSGVRVATRRRTNWQVIRWLQLPPTQTSRFLGWCNINLVMMNTLIFIIWNSLAQILIFLRNTMSVMSEDTNIKLLFW